jgi:hypothetical protein
VGGSPTATSRRSQLGYGDGPFCGARAVCRESAQFARADFNQFESTLLIVVSEQMATIACQRRRRQAVLRPVDYQSSCQARAALNILGGFPGEALLIEIIAVLHPRQYRGRQQKQRSRMR